MSGINDLVVKFANVNGSGSASANEMFAKTLFRMGIMVSPKNIFPSNIQGLPTWYEVRVSGEGYTARRDGIDIMVAMNPQTFKQDLAEIVPGGYLIYDSTLPRRWEREDITVLGVPAAEIVAKEWTDTRQRQLLKNMVYVGALTALLDMDMATIEQVVVDQFKGRTQAVTGNRKALALGRTYAEEHFQCPLPIKVKTSDVAKGKILVKGNDAAGLGAIYAGATVCAWYPITPSTSVAEAFEKYLKKFRTTKDGKKLGAIVQAEDELSAIGVVIGAAWNGARSFTATSGPGISLMSEFLGLAYVSELPVVLFNIQRGGPSTGMPTRTQQSDILSCAYASHGDTKHVLLFPKDPRECFELGVEAFNLADKLQTPVMVMSDLDIGMNDWVCDPFQWDDKKNWDRGKVLDAASLEKFKEVKGKEWGRYLDIDGDGVPYRTLPGTHPTQGAFFTRGTSHDEYARYTEDGRINARIMERLSAKFETGAKSMPKAEINIRAEAGKIGVLYFGSTDPAVREGLDRLEAAGLRVNSIRLKAFPFGAEVLDFMAKHDKIFVVEQNRDGQMCSLLMLEAGVPQEKLIPTLNFDGMPLTAEFVETSIRANLEQGQGAGRAKKMPAGAAE